MPTKDPTGNPLDDLAEEFARRWREGDRPSVEEYVERYPQWADDIRELLPAVLMMEHLKPRRDDATLTGPDATTVLGAAPERLGEYRIVREIGRGGMGVVYEGEHEALRRRVAIKVLAAHLVANDKLRSRFRREAQAAARLHHTNIVPVFGVGEDAGCCFYVMQLIEGASLGTANADGAARQGEDPRAVARIGVQVADALAYAHSQGVLHRDIKPSNLLLDQRGAVWVTDFGVAKFVEDAALTQSGEFVGTLRYMPPERLRGHSDARGDAYGLGVTLYELLAGRPAFPEATPHQLLQLIGQSDPMPLRRLDPSIPADLETVVLKAAARDPERRYQTAAELADDLRRFLDDRPILARRAGAAEQLWRWCRRNRLVAGLSAAAVALLALTATVSLIAYVRTAAAGRDKDLALRAEQVQREQAQETSAAALHALNRIYDRFAPYRVIVTPPSADPTDRDSAEAAQPVLAPEAVPLLEELLGFYEQLARDAGDQPELEAQAAEANQRIGDLRQRLGEYEPAVEAYQKAVALYTHLADEGGGERTPLLLARTYNELGRVLFTVQHNAEGSDALAQALAVLTAVRPALAARPEYRFELARSYYFHVRPPIMPGPPPGGRGSRGRGGPPRPRGFGSPPPALEGRRGPPPRVVEDRRAADRAIGLLEPLVKEHPDVPEYRHLLACCYRDRPPERMGGRPGSTEDNVQQAIKILRKLAVDFPRVPDYRYDLCETLARAGFPGPPGVPTPLADARKLLDEAARLAAGLLADYPNVPQYRAADARVHEKLALALQRAGRLEDAEKELRRAMATQARLVQRQPEVSRYEDDLARMEATLARFLMDRGDWKGARPLLEDCAGRLESVIQREPQARFPRALLGRTYRDLADVLTRLGEKDRAAEARRKAQAAGPDVGPGPFGPPGRGGDGL
jgi:tetratricopeptide (TPR) repeat protein/tRNA A-37 threonylcarbamoyl transferase component Bud32